MRTLQLGIKRCFDFIFAGVASLLMLPFWLIIGVIMKITMPGPLFFKQERIGKRFKPFLVLKFRTMKVDKEAEKNHRFEKDSQRITPLGRVLRRTKLDETPQIINVLIGDMSLVGPRPTIKEVIEKYPDGQQLRHSMRPGMTGLSQIRGNILLSWPRRIEYDCEYVKEFSLLVDVQILIKTIGVVLFGEERFISAYDLENNKDPNYDVLKNGK